VSNSALCKSIGEKKLRGQTRCPHSMPVSNRLQSTCSQCGLLLLLSCAAAFGAPIDHYTPDPDGVPIDFICAYREYAAEFAARLRPDFDQTIVFDALMLGSLCNKTYSDIARPASAEPAIVRENPRPADSTIYVAVSGDDSNPGTEAKPMKTVGAGLVASRKIPGPAKTLSVGPGTYYLTSTLTLTDKDEGLLITGTGKVWLSGAKPLPTALKWEQYKLGPTPEGGGTRVNIWKTILPRRFHTLPQLRVNGGRSPRARHPNASEWLFDRHALIHLTCSDHRLSSLPFASSFPLFSQIPRPISGLLDTSLTPSGSPPRLLVSQRPSMSETQRWPSVERPSN
jgi:hypothetical protein